jgi:hypothetical protein
LAQKTHFRAGRHENKENCIFFFGFRILLPFQIQLLDFENSKNPKIDSPYCRCAAGFSNYPFSRLPSIAL